MKTYISVFFIILVGVVLHGLTLRGSWGNPDAKAISQMTARGQAFESSHERSPYATVLALDINKTPELTFELAEVGAPDVGYYNQKFYSYFPVGLPALIYPAYLLGKSYNLAQIATYAMMSVFTLGTMLCLYGVARRMFGLEHWASILAAMVYAFSSPAWSYSVTIYQHALTVFLLISGFWGAWEYSRRSRWGWLGAIWAGLAFGIGAFVDYPNVIIMFPILLLAGFSAFSFKPQARSWLIKFRVSILTMVVVVAALAGGHAYYNDYFLGSWRTMTNALVRYEGSVKSAAVLNADASDIEAETEKKQDVSGVLSEVYFPRGLFVLLVAEDKGLFVFAPIFVLGVLGLVRASSTIAGSGWLNTIIGLNIFVYASFGDPWGGWAFGPRYLVPAMAVLSLYVGYALSEYGHKLWFSLMGILLLSYSSAIAALGVMTSNAVPPRVEADYFGIKYGFWVNIDLLKEGVSSSFVFNNWVHEYLSVWEFYSAIVYYLIIMWIVLLVIIPRTQLLFNKKTVIV